MARFDKNSQQLLHATHVCRVVELRHTTDGLFHSAANRLESQRILVDVVQQSVLTLLLRLLVAMQCLNKAEQNGID